MIPPSQNHEKIAKWSDKELKGYTRKHHGFLPQFSSRRDRQNNIGILIFVDGEMYCLEIHVYLYL